jgi:hypothetical protein
MAIDPGIVVGAGMNGWRSSALADAKWTKLGH